MNTASPAPGDSGSAAAALPASTRYPAATLAATVLGSSVAFIDGSVVNVALAAIGRDLAEPSAVLSWVVNSYLLPVGALTLLGGGAGDRFGRRRLFLIGLALFTAASLLCAAAPGFSVLLAARALQGLGAALLLPNSLAILGASFSGEARGKAIGTWAAAGALAGALGPLIGGLIVDTAGWRAIFLINLPIATGAACLALAFVPEGAGADQAPLDWWGAVAATLGLLIITWALTAGGRADADLGLLWVAGAGGLGLLALFVWIEKSRGEHALMPLALFATRTFAGLTLLTFFLYASLGGLVVLLPFLLIRAAGYSATAAGAAMLPLPLVIGLGSRLMGRLAGRFGGRWPLTIGALMVAAGFALYLRVRDPIAFWTDILPPTLLIAAGMGICVAPLTTSVMSAVDNRHVGAASGFNSAIARVASLIATALLGYVLALQGSTAALLAGFHGAVLVGAVSAAVAAFSAFALMAD